MRQAPVFLAHRRPARKRDPLVPDRIPDQVDSRNPRQENALPLLVLPVGDPLLIEDANFCTLRTHIVSIKLKQPIQALDYLIPELQPHALLGDRSQKRFEYALRFVALI